jgi:hypothetical protein
MVKAAPDTTGARYNSRPFEASGPSHSSDGHKIKKAGFGFKRRLKIFLAILANAKWCRDDSVFRPRGC